MLKQCTKCKETKEDIDFSKNISRKDGLASWCLLCTRTYGRSSAQLSSNKKYQENNKDKYKLSRRKTWYKTQYGITLDQYDAMRVKQEHSCYICGKHETLNKKLLSVDHDHDTGIVRKLLCHPCNTGLGLFLDSPKLLRRASEYLLEHGKADD